MPDAASSERTESPRGQPVTVRPARLPEELEAVQQLCWEYRDHLVHFGPEQREIVTLFYPKADYAALMRTLPEKHARPRGEILLAEVGGVLVGCGMTQPISDSAAEIKRVFVRKSARGNGAGRALSQALVAQARADGYRTVYLDTSREFEVARSLYLSIGFRERGPYSDVPEVARDKLSYFEFNLGTDPDDMG